MNFAGCRWTISYEIEKRICHWVPKFANKMLDRSAFVHLYPTLYISIESFLLKTCIGFSFAFDSSVLQYPEYFKHQAKENSRFQASIKY